MALKTFYSNGKLLLTSEYTVLNGAKALALPTVFGQNLIVEENRSEKILWRSFNADQSVWINVEIPFSEIIGGLSSRQNPLEAKLINILHEAFKLNPNFLDKGNGYHIETHLTFPRLWGLGTSSTLISNIAQWLQINPYKLLETTFNGSGYDIACATNNTPILFWLEGKNPIVETVEFYPEFSENLYFVYLNKKQNSKSAIANYCSKQHDITQAVEQTDKITTQILQAKELSEFAELIEKHENVMSELLDMKTIKETLFSDFKGVIKSLGAWGGDFVLAVFEENPTKYFNKKGFKTVIPYQKMILLPVS